MAEPSVLLQRKNKAVLLGTVFTCSHCTGRLLPAKPAAFSRVTAPDLFINVPYQQEEGHL